MQIVKNINWAKKLFARACAGRSEVAMRRGVKMGNSISLSLVGQPITLSFEGGDYYVSGGPRGRILAGWSWYTAIGTMFSEMARTVPE